MRNAFATEITRLAVENNDVVLLSGDIGNRLFDEFKANCPDRFFNCGVAEGNMMGVAAGMAMSGLRPLVYTIAPFVTTRCLEQIRIDICHHNAPVVIVGVGSGLSYASLGATHQSLEDIAFLRALPRMTVLSPSDPADVRWMLKAAFTLDGPTYIRMGKKGEPDLHTDSASRQIGKAVTMREGNDVCIIATGSMVSVALEAAQIAAGKDVELHIVNMHTIKPLDTAVLHSLHRIFPIFITLEEHSKIGGLGGAVAEWASGLLAGGPVIHRLGTGDHFLECAGGQSYARAQHQLDAQSVANAVVSLARKSVPA